MLSESAEASQLRERWQKQTAFSRVFSLDLLERSVRSVEVIDMLTLSLGVVVLKAAGGGAESGRWESQARDGRGGSASRWRQSKEVGARCSHSPVHLTLIGQHSRSLMSFLLRSAASSPSRDSHRDFSIDMEAEEEWEALTLNPNQPLITRQVLGTLVLFSFDLLTDPAFSSWLLQNGVFDSVTLLLSWSHINWWREKTSS